MKRTHLVIVTIALVIAAIAVGVLLWPGRTTNSNEAATKVSVRLPIPVIEAGQTPFYLAADRGYYADEDLSVTFGMGSEELNPIKMVASGQDDFGVIGGPELLAGMARRGGNATA